MVVGKDVGGGADIAQSDCEVFQALLALREIDAAA